MKTVILFRHGKSDWDANYGADHERPLAKRGIRAAKAMGRWLRQTDQVPDYFCASSAVRARTTLALACEAGAWEGQLHIRPELYDASVSEYLEVIRSTPEEAQRVLLAGHEPTCSMTTSLLSGGGLVRFPTATMARIDLDIESWEEIGSWPGFLVWFMPPKFLE